MLEGPIRLTNLSAMPAQTYDACPFCFSKLGENVDNVVLKEAVSFDVSAQGESESECVKPPRDLDLPERLGCSHHFGYLKKRPKSEPIPEACLTCQKMIQCIL